MGMEVRPILPPRRDATFSVRSISMSCEKSKMRPDGRRKVEIRVEWSWFPSICGRKKDKKEDRGHQMLESGGRRTFTLKHTLAEMNRSMTSGDSSLRSS